MPPSQLTCCHSEPSCPGRSRYRLARSLGRKPMSRVENRLNIAGHVEKTTIARSAVPIYSEASKKIRLSSPQLVPVGCSWKRPPRGRFRQSDSGCSVRSARQRTRLTRAPVRRYQRRGRSGLARNDSLRRADARARRALPSKRSVAAKPACRNLILDRHRRVRRVSPRPNQQHR